MRRVGSFFLLLEKTWKCCYSKYFFPCQVSQMWMMKSNERGFWDKICGILCVYAPPHLVCGYVFFCLVAFSPLMLIKIVSHYENGFFMVYLALRWECFTCCWVFFIHFSFFTHDTWILFSSSFFLTYFLVERVKRITLEVLRDSSQPKHSVE